MCQAWYVQIFVWVRKPISTPFIKLTELYMSNCNLLLLSVHSYRGSGTANESSDDQVTIRIMVIITLLFNCNPFAGKHDSTKLKQMVIVRTCGHWGKNGLEDRDQEKSFQAC